VRAIFRWLAGKPPDLKREKYTAKQFRTVLIHAGYEIVAEQEYSKLLLPYPFTHFWPRLAFGVARWAEEKKGLGFFATGHLVMCRKP